MRTPTGKERWIVSWTESHTGTDWDLMRNSQREFATEVEALEFAGTKTHKRREFYWQPTVWKEVEEVEQIERLTWRKESSVTIKPKDEPKPKLRAGRGVG